MQESFWGPTKDNLPGPNIGNPKKDHLKHINEAKDVSGSYPVENCGLSSDKHKEINAQVVWIYIENE